MRDALSIFDRVVSFSGKQLTRKAVTENLNVLDYETYFEATEHVLAHNIPALLLLFNKTLSLGFDGHHFISGLASHFRDLMVCQHQNTIALLEVGEGAKQNYLEQSKKTSNAFLLKALSIATDCDLKYKTSKNQRLLVELSLMKLASIDFDGEKKNLESVADSAGKTDFIAPASFYKENSRAQTITTITENKNETAVVSKTSEKLIATSETIAEPQTQKTVSVTIEAPASAGDLTQAAISEPVNQTLVQENPAAIKNPKEIEPQGEVISSAHIEIPKIAEKSIHIETPTAAVESQINEANPVSEAIKTPIEVSNEPAFEVETTFVQSQTNTTTKEEPPILSPEVSTVVVEPEVEVSTEENEPFQPRVEETKVTVPKINISLAEKRVSALSISSLKAKKIHEENRKDASIDESQLPREAFAEEIMQAHWADFVQKLDDAGKKILASNLNADIPKLRNENTLWIELPNDTMKKEIEREKYDLMEYLKAKLNNHFITLQITVNEATAKKFAFTPEEKYQKLQEKNPVIDLLRKEFDLDL